MRLQRQPPCKDRDGDKGVAAHPRFEILFAAQPSSPRWQWHLPAVDRKQLAANSRVHAG
jgi:hypothetical protein